MLDAEYFHPVGDDPPPVPSEQLSRTATTRTGTTQADAAVASARRQLGRSSASLWAGTTTRTWSIGTVTILSSPWYGRVFFRPGSQQITTFRTGAAARPPAAVQVENCFGETSLDTFERCAGGVQDGVLRLCFRVQNGVLHRRIFRTGGGAPNRRASGPPRAVSRWCAAIAERAG